MTSQPTATAANLDHGRPAIAVSLDQVIAQLRAIFADANTPPRRGPAELPTEIVVLDDLPSPDVILVHQNRDHLADILGDLTQSAAACAPAATASR